MTQLRIPLAILILVSIAAIWWFDIYQYLTLEFYREQQQFIQDFVRDNQLLSIGIFFAVYVTATTLSLPVAGVFCVLSGALFGMVLGTVVISFASTIGATCAFLVSRFILQDYVDRRFPHAAERVNDGILQDGPYYLFSIRLVPAFPYFVVNMVMGLTHMPVLTFAWVTQLGLLPITLVLTNAGEQFALIKSPGDIISPMIMGSLILIGLFPLIAKKLLDTVRTRKST
ncbi:MAG: TVP38/TMEM64 family protein [Gammaproteobacteria bacterium]